MFDPKEFRSYYDGFYKDGDFQHYPFSITEAVLRTFKKRYFRTGLNILDLGCGTGFHIHVMKSIGLKPVGIDLSLVGLRAAKKKLRSSQLVQSDALLLPFNDDIFDGAISFGCSLMNGSSISLFQSFIKESLRVVKKSGWMLAITQSDFSGECISGWHHLRATEFKQVMDINCRQAKMFVSFARLFPILKSGSISKIISLLIQYVPIKKNRMVLLAFQK